MNYVTGPEKKAERFGDEPGLQTNKDYAVAGIISLEKFERYSDCRLLEIERTLKNANGLWFVPVSENLTVLNVCFSHAPCRGVFLHRFSFPSYKTAVGAYSRKT